MHIEQWANSAKTALLYALIANVCEISMGRYAVSIVDIFAVVKTRGRKIGGLDARNENEILW